MKDTIAFLLLGILPGTAFGSTIDHKAMFRLWQKPVAPAMGKAEAIGSYSAGCLLGGQKLARDGQGYSVMRPSRSRYYGHPDLVQYIEDLGSRVRKAGLPLMLVGDLGRPRGGPMISGHASHQSGLDVDLWYRFAKKRPTNKDREKWGADSYVTKNGVVGRGWKDEQRKLVALAAESSQVDRVFVHVAIKKDMCRAYPDAPWLHKLRPWWGHDDHLHVRLRCPEGSANCQGQEPAVASAEHCGSELDWWYSEEAKEELAKKKASHGREFPSLPDACHELVADYLADNKKP